MCRRGFVTGFRGCGERFAENRSAEVEALLTKAELGQYDAESGTVIRCAIRSRGQMGSPGKKFNITPDEGLVVLAVLAGLIVAALIAGIYFAFR